MYIYPNEDRYVLISSGLPWWHSPEGQTATGGGIFGGDVDALRLSGMGDFLLFHRSPDNVIASGRFDRGWQLPAEAAEAMQHSGAVNMP